VNTGSTSSILPESTSVGSMDRVRVLHINAGNLYGGVETLLTTLARYRSLCPGMEPHFAVCYSGRYSQELAAAGVPVYELGGARISRPWTVWQARRRLRELFQTEQFDMVVCHMPWSLVVFGKAVRGAGNKVVFGVHGQPAEPTWLDRMASRFVPDLVIANSHFTADLVGSCFGNAPVQVLYPPVALAETPDADDWRRSLRRKEGVEEDAVVILQASRLEPWKGHLIHFHALAQLKDRSKWVCWIAGGAQTPEEERYLRELKRAAEQLGIASRLRFLGQRSDIPKILAAADIFCQPNLGPEPFGIVFIEALWAGRPVVTTAMGGPVEIVDESCGFLVEPGNASALAAKLGDLVEAPHLRARLGQCGRARARQLCDPAQQMQMLEQHFRRLIRNNFV
jgi:glycosyltransferase involved in cell wall biosynthesis